MKGMTKEGDMGKLVRFGVSLPEELVEEFDRTIREVGYFSRSRAIGDAIHTLILEQACKKNGELIATISFIYNHGSKQVTDSLTKLRHKYKGILSAIQTHVNKDECVEVLIVEGKQTELRRLVGEITAVRGVISCRVSALCKRKRGEK